MLLHTHEQIYPCVITTSCNSVYIFTYLCSYCTVWKFSEEVWWSWQITIGLKSSHFSATIIPLYIWGWIYPIAKLFITKTFIRVNSPNPPTSYNYMVIICLLRHLATKWLSKQFLMFTSISFYIASYMSATVLKLVSNSFLIFCIIMPKMLNLFNLTVINYMFIWYNIQLVQNTIMLYNDIIYL